MNELRRHLPSPAMVVACVALVVALGGVSYAATVLPKNSVGTDQLRSTAVSAAKLKKNAVRSGKVRKDAITTDKVKDGTLLARDFGAGQLPAGSPGPKGDKGDPGIPGDRGPKGDPGPAGISGHELVEGNGVPLNPGDEGLSYAWCPAGKKIVGGGVSGNARLAIVDSMPSGNNGWRVYARNIGASGGNFAAEAICTNVD